MKNFYLIFIFIFTSLLFSQVPAGYYDSALGTGYTLKTQLKQIIDDSNDGLTTEYLAVQKTYNDLYTAYQTTDIDNFTEAIYENDNTVLDMYSESESTTMGDSYNFNHSPTDQCGTYTGEGQCYNREHIFAQGFFNEQLPMRSDVHFVPPTDGYVNNRRSNYPFGEVTSPTWISQNGSKVGFNTSSPSYTGSAFEPIDEFKGDIARMLFYFAARYEDEVTSGSWDAHDAVPENPLNGTNDQVYEDWYIDLLVSWHSSDPVSPREISRNNACFAFQNNRNPFIDHPEYVNLIWNPAADTEAPTAPSNLVASNPTSSKIDLTWTASTDNVGVTSYDIYLDGVNTYNTSNTTYIVTELTSETNYCFTVYAKDAAGNTSTVSNQDCETTLTGNSTTVELFISEYVEGSGNNKVIEIANFTGSTVNLSIFSLARNTNSGAAWGTALQLSGNISDQDVFVIARGDSDAAAQAQADQLSSSDAMSFNGDDPVGLFKDGTLIDIFGNFNGTNSFSNKTIRRKSTVANPTTSFNLTEEWDEFLVNTFDGLGNHNQTLEIENRTIKEVKFYPNPLNGNKLIFETNHSLNIEIFNILGKKIITDEVNTNKNYFFLTSLSSGIYLIKISNGNQTTTKKLIRQ